MTDRPATKAEIAAARKAIRQLGDEADASFGRMLESMKENQRGAVNLRHAIDAILAAVEASAPEE